MEKDIVNVPQELLDQILEYCKLNKIEDIQGFTVNILKQGFAVEKYGTTPFGAQKEIVEKEIIKEIEVEKIVEVPVEVEKIVEKIIEVPVEKIVEKIITDDSQVQELLTKIDKLEKQVIAEKSKTSDSELGKLYQKIENLEALLEIEKNRNKVKKEVENPFGDKPKSSITWVSRDERENDLYGE